MKLTAFIMLLGCIQVSANGFTQAVSLSVKDIPLEKAFPIIEKQSGFFFIYNKDQISHAHTITVQLKDATLENVLDACFKGQPFTYSIVNKLIVVKERNGTSAVTPSDWIQIADTLINVKGKVVNEKGEPVEGVSVIVKGTSKGTTTDANGEFALTMDKDAVLVFNHVSMETFELKVNGKTSLAIHLKTKLTALGDVEVVANTGYQFVKPNEVTGSLSVIDNKILNQQIGTNILQRLNNVTSGLYFNIGKVNTNPQSNTNISIRGLSTINGPLDPLIVLDNFIYEGDINNINPNDVESITILKDAAATSIWGARAGNGVIVITTKKAKFNQRLKVDFNTDFIFTEKPDLYYLSQISSNDYINVEQYLFNKGYFDNTINNIYQRPPLTPATEVFLKRKNGLISAADSASEIDALKKIDSRGQYEKYFYQEALTQQYNLSLKGGSNNMSWLVSGSYDRSVYTLKNEYDKVNFRLVNTYKPIKNLQINIGCYYTSSRSLSGISTGYSINGRQVPYLSFVDDNGNPLSISRYNDDYIDTVGGGKLLDWKYYPLEDYKHDKTTTKVQEILADISLNYEFFKDFAFNVNYQYQKQNTNSKRLADLESFYARDLINTYSQLDYATGNVNYIIPKGGIFDEYGTNVYSQNLRGQLTLDKTFNDHLISAIAGFEVREIINNGNTSRLYGYTEDPLSYATVDFKNYYPTFISGNYQSVPNPPSLPPTINNRFVSFFSNASYSYKQKYILYGSIRKDASNVFGLNTNDKWNPLWSIGIGWNISKEKFYKMEWLPDLKLRSSFGYSGNVDVNKTPLPISTSGLTDLYTNLPVLVINNPNNPSLKWEKTGQLNLGVDFSLKNNIITGSVDYYQKKGDNLYGITAFDYTSFPRTTEVIKNVANMKGKGIDVVLRIKDIDRNFKWNTTCLLNYNSNKTTAYFAPGAQTLYSLVSSGKAITPVIGYPLYAIAAYKWAGLNSSGDPQGYLNGQISTDYNAITTQDDTKGNANESIVYVGPASPKYFGSLINEFNWKGFFASFNISYSFGYYFRKTPFTSDALINNGFATADFSKRWQVPGDETKTSVPAFVYTDYPQFNERDNFYAYSEINVLKADNIRFQYFNFGYSLNGKKYRLPVEQIQIYFNIANLGIIWRANEEHLDPDYPSTLTVPKSWTIGMRISF